ncbi:3-keto-disaccharide hydrolase [Eudoraea sp.]|uniref:3-keto-disaccharide hydrolase n=1 Tax=Eudoraea sp. TaxID=1979955 RepID=UPI003C769E73
MKNLVVLTLFTILMIGCKVNKKDEKTLEDELEIVEVKSPVKDEWVILFDGTSFDGWKGYLMDGVPETWKLEEGAMVLYPKKNESSNLITEKEYTDFVLSVEWKISEGGNSGIFLGVMEDETLKEPYETGPEIQVLDNEKHPDAKAGTTHQAGALYDMIAPSEDVTKAVGEWNLCEITINHKEDLGMIVLNGVEIVRFPTNGEPWDEMVGKSKFADWKAFGKYTTGKIGLQDHGDKVSFRNIKIKEL